MTFEGDQAESLDSYWSALSRNHDATPPPDLDSTVGHLVWRLDTALRPPKPRTEFVEALRGRLEDKLFAATTSGQVGMVHGWSMRTFASRRWVAVGLATTLALLLAVSLASNFPWNRSPESANAETIVARAVAAAGSLAAGGVPSFQLREITESWPGNSGISGLASYQGPVRSASTWWYVSPQRWKVSGRYLVLPRIPGMRGDELLGGTAFYPVPGTVISDGQDIWRYDWRNRMLQVDHISPRQDLISQYSPLGPIPPFGRMTGNLRALLVQAKACWRPVLKGKAPIAGHESYIVDLGPNLCLRRSNSADESSGRSILWVDARTFFVLKFQQFDPTNSAKLLAQTTVTSIRYHPHIDVQLLRFAAPAGSMIADSRSRALAAARPYNRVVARLARQMSFPLLVPYDRPAGLNWSIPRRIAPDRVQLTFVPLGSRDGGTGRRGVTVVERRATAADLVPTSRRMKSVAVNGAAGWYSDTRTGHQLVLVREGTSITTTSRVLGRAPLIAFARIFVPAFGGHAPIAVAGMPPLIALRRQLSFPIFVPGWLPPGFRTRSITQGDGQRNPPNSVEVQYQSGARSLSVFESWAGCCLDQDLRKWVNPIPLPNGVTAFRMQAGPRFGGLYIWWEQAGTYISISSAQLSQRQLVRIAGSMSKAATSL